MKRLVIVTEIISPYRIPLFNALARRKDLSVHVIFLAETDPVLRKWRVYKEEIRFSYQVLPSWRARAGTHHLLLNWGLTGALGSASPDVILVGGYNYVASWQTLWWARSHRIPFLLWSESTKYDSRHGWSGVELLKNKFLDRCSGFVVPGISAREYLISLGHEEACIFPAPNAVDNEFFAHGAAEARGNDTQLRAQLGLPARYFLFVGRFVKEKGIFDLLAAYGSLGVELRASIGLVFAGDGVERKRLEESARSISPGQIRFTGFVHREQLPVYYGLADLLVLPSWTEPWGLVVNEAMASGVPVAVSRVAGCAADLVPDESNGFIFSAKDIEGLSNVMERMGNNPAMRCAMGKYSAQRIAAYSPQSWTVGIVDAVNSVSITP